MSIRFDEVDVENLLYENPNKIKIYGKVVKEWIARQYNVPSGIVDLIGYMGKTVNDDPMFCVVEVKNVSVDSRAITQVTRYSSDLAEILINSCALAGGDRFIEYSPVIYKAIVGDFNFVQDKVMFEANAANVILFSFSVSIDLDIRGPYHWTEEKRNKLYDSYYKCSKDFVKYFTEEDVFEEFMNKLEDKDSKE